MRFFPFAFLTFSILASAAASANPVFAVQLGSFESKEEADAALSALKAKHGAVLQPLTTRVQEAVLPPENLPVYRTQAGPLATRADAASICSQLTSHGDSCYVVESADAPSPTAAAEATIPPTPATAAVDPSIDQMNAALAHAAQSTPTVQTLGKTPTSSAPHTSKKKTKSFWSYLNPFSEDSDASDATATDTAPQSPLPAPPPSVAAEAPTAQAVPVEPVRVQEARAKNPAAAPAVATPGPIASLLVPPSSFSPPYRNASPDTRADASAVAGPAAPPPSSELSLAQPAAKTATPAPEAAPTLLSPVPADVVEVEEAQRVPLSSATNLPPLPSAPAATTMPAVDLHPSATVGKKSLWAAIGPFNDAPFALQYWENYRTLHPDFPVVRIRTVSSYADKQQGNNRAFLRVGPFTHSGFIRNLCSTVMTDTLRCGAVTDLGIAQPPQGAMLLPSSRYAR